MPNQITGFNWDGTPIYGLGEVTITPKSQVSNSTTGQKIDWNNVIDNVPGLITSIAGAVKKTPEINYYGTDPSTGNGGNNTTMYIIAAIVLVAIFIMIKK